MQVDELVSSSQLNVDREEKVFQVQYMAWRDHRVMLSFVHPDIV